MAKHLTVKIFSGFLAKEIEGRINQFLKKEQLTFEELAKIKQSLITTNSGPMIWITVWYVK